MAAAVRAWCSTGSPGMCSRVAGQRPSKARNVWYQRWFEPHSRCSRDWRCKRPRTRMPTMRPCRSPSHPIQLQARRCDTDGEDRQSRRCCSRRASAVAAAAAAAAWAARVGTGCRGSSQNTRRRCRPCWQRRRSSRRHREGCRFDSPDRARAQSRWQGPVDSPDDPARVGS